MPPLSNPEGLPIFLLTNANYLHILLHILNASRLHLYFRTMNTRQNPFIGAWGLKKTRGRIEVLNYLKRISAPVDASQIESYLIDTKNTSINTATIYRILRILYKKGLVIRFELQEGKFRYELASKPDHHHLICQSCGNIEDVSDNFIADIETEIKNKKRFLVKSHSMEFFGLCKQCQP